MHCLKCTGLMVEERITDYYRPFTVLRYLSCGAMIDWQVYQNRLASKAKGVEMPKFQSEESRAKWIEAVRRTKAAKKKRENVPLAHTDDGTAVPVVTEVDASPEPPAAAVHAVVLQCLDRAIEGLARDREALERVKSILSR